MKSFAIFAVFLLCVDLSLQIPKLVNCPDDFELSSSMANGCGIITCNGTNFAGKGCGQYLCMPGKQEGYVQPDNSKPYPDCCGGPICAD